MSTIPASTQAIVIPFIEHDINEPASCIIWNIYIYTDIIMSKKVVAKTNPFVFLRYVPEQRLLLKYEGVIESILMIQQIDVKIFLKLFLYILLTQFLVEQLLPQLPYDAEVKIERLSMSVSFTSKGMMFTIYLSTFSRLGLTSAGP